MYIDQTKYTTRPTGGRIPQEFAIYDRLEELSIPYVRVDHDHADTIEICHEVEKVLGAQICKNLFLCNRVLSADDAGGQALQDQVSLRPAGLLPAVLRR